MWGNRVLTLPFVNILNRTSRNLALVAAVLPVISACSPNNDLQGRNPYEYYSNNPIENKVETRHSLIPANFDRKSGELLDKENFVSGIADIRPRAVDEIVLQVPASMPNKKQHIDYIAKLLRANGHKKPIKVISKETPELYEAIVDITHAAVVSPDCPDWKLSPVTTYSNMPPANYGCAAAVNLGLMIDDPHDLVRGRDSTSGDARRSGKVLTDYHSGAAAGSSGSSPVMGQ